MLELEEGVQGYDGRHVLYCGSKDGKNDVHMVKEYVHWNDGTRTPRIRLIDNFEREIYTTKEAFRNHNDKKEYELEKNLQRWMTRQCQMEQVVSRALYSRPAAPGTRMSTLSESPYLYGSDISSCSLIKKLYSEMYPKSQYPSASVAVLDIEADVIWGTNEIIIVTLSFKDKIVTTVNKKFIPDTKHNRTKLEYLFEKHLGKFKKEREIVWELEFCDTPGKCCARVMERAHQWMPDFITVWNIDYDIPKIIDTIEKENMDPAQMFSDPIIPDEYKFYRYRQGKPQKETASGKIIPLHYADRWHTVECPASFYFLDAMCLYKYIRLAKGNEASYALDDVLNKHIGMGKLSIPEVDHLEKLAWHQAMQREYPLDYVIYNVFDCIGVELLDEKTKDISQTFPIQCGFSDFRSYRSNPKKIVDKFHFFLKERGLIIGTAGTDMMDENDEFVVGMKDWIVTLPAHLTDNNGLPLIEGLDELCSLIRIHLADLDIEGTYPTEEYVFNISKETTLLEMIRVQGMSEIDVRRFGINMSGGVINAVELVSKAYNLPTPEQWVELFEAEERELALENQKEKQVA